MRIIPFAFALLVVAPQDPKGRLWDALGRLPDGEGAAVELFDYADVRAQRGAYIGTSSYGNVEKAWSQFSRFLGLPEKDFGQVIAVGAPTSPSDVILVATRTPLEDILKTSAAHGRVADGATPPVRLKSKLGPEDSGTVRDACFEGWVAHAEDPGVIEKLIEVRAGKTRPLCARAEVKEIVSLMPDVVPSWVVYGKAVTPQGMPHAPRVAGGWLEGKAVGSTKRTDLLLFENGDQARAVAAFVESRFKESAIPGRTVSTDGKLLKIARSFGPADLKQYVRVDLLNLRNALEMHYMDQGRYPTSEEGIAALGKGSGMRPPTLDLPFGQAPRDPWNRDYVYRFPSAKDPGRFDLFSAGPDGKPDTEDDLKAE